MYVILCSVLLCVFVWRECTHLTATRCPKVSGIFRTCAMNSAATASYNAVPSILIVAPIGITNLATRGSTPFFSSKQPIATGNVAELEYYRTPFSL